jgi:hypothetical protein
MTTTGLLIVHGIGEQLPGMTTEKLVLGLTEACGDRLSVQRGEDGQAVALTVGDRRVRVYEVYWADLLSREANRGAMTWATLPTLVWHPLLCRRAGVLPGNEYASLLVNAWLALLLPASLLAYPVTQGARVLAQTLDPDRAARVAARAQGLSFWQAALARADATAHDDTLVEETLEGVVADVPNYMGSVARGEGVAFDVLARFHRAMRMAHDDGCEVIHVLAHSLGTVVAYHALTGLGQADGEARHAPRRLFTIGSPLEKIRFFWPWTVRRESPSAHPEFRWTNFYHSLDFVSGKLRRFGAWAPLDNVRLKGGGGILRSHVVYEQSPEFLGALTMELFGAREAPRLTPFHRLKDRFLTAAENLLGPAAALAALALGLALIVIVLLAGPYLFSLPLRWLGADAWADRVGDGLSLLVISVMSVGLIMRLRSCYLDARAGIERVTRASAD